MRITSKGQITIPQEFRLRFGLLPNTEVEFLPEGQGLKLVKSKRSSGKGMKLVEHLRGKGDGKMTTDEIMKLTRGE